MKILNHQCVLFYLWYRIVSLKVLIELVALLGHISDGRSTKYRFFGLLLIKFCGNLNLRSGPFTCTAILLIVIKVLRCLRNGFLAPLLLLENFGCDLLVVVGLRQVELLIGELFQSKVFLLCQVDGTLVLKFLRLIHLKFKFIKIYSHCLKY